MELQGERVRIRPWRQADDDTADEWPPYNDPLNGIWNLPRPFSTSSFGWPPFSEGAMRQSWAVDERYSRVLMGRISLRDIDSQRRQARLGLPPGAPFVSRGLGTGALVLFLRGSHTMVLDVAAPNLRAVRCYERLGFRYVGSDWREAGALIDRRLLDTPGYADLARHFRRNHRGIWVEFFEMRLAREEWFARRPVRQY